GEKKSVASTTCMEMLSIGPLQWCDLSAQTRFPMSTSTYKALPWVALMSLFLTHAKCAELETAVNREQPKVLEWRRDFHRHPELSNRETRTAKIVADHLRKLGLEVET